MPHDTTGRFAVCTERDAAPHYGTRCLRKQGIFLQHTCNLDTVSPLCAPFLPLLPLSAIIIIRPPPPFFFKSKFPFAARSAECCCLLCTQKFAEAVSCPQTSAPWSGVGEERQGLGGCTCCLMWLCQNVLCMDLYVCVHARVSEQLFKSMLGTFLNALLAAPSKQNTYLCNCTHGIHIGTHTHTHKSRCTSFQLSWCTNCLVVKYLNEPDRRAEQCVKVCVNKEKQ